MKASFPCRITGLLAVIFGSDGISGAWLPIGKFCGDKAGD